jgi:hypothetical protein
MSLSNDSNDDLHLKEIIKRRHLVQFDKVFKINFSPKVIINDQKAAMGRSTFN